LPSTINASNSGFGGIVSTGDSSGVLQLQSAGTTAVTIDTSQNVTFNGTRIYGDFTNATIANRVSFQTSTTNGATRLMVIPNGTSDVAAINCTNSSDPTNASFAAFQVQQSSDVRIQSTIAGTGTYLPMTFYTGGSERMRIDSSGNVLVGTTSALANGKISSLATSSSQRPLGLSSNYSGDVGVSAIYITKFDNNSTTTQVFQQFAIGNGAAGSGQINANGANAAAFGSFSDARLKENIEPLPPQLDNILALKPCEFDFKDGSGHQVGFIAQEMQLVYPDVVGQGNDEMLTVTGWDKTSARLVKAIQEQQTIINDLKARIETLEAK
jgi:hypothetical protein